MWTVYTKNRNHEKTLRKRQKRQQLTEKQTNTQNRNIIFLDLACQGGG